MNAFYEALFMKLICRKLFLTSVVLLSACVVSAQDNNVVQMPIKVSIPMVSLVGFAGSGAPNNISGKGAVQRVTPSTTDTTWINYSSVVDDNTTNSLSVNIISGNLPAQVVVKLNVGEDVGAGAGTMGKPVGKIILSEYPQTVITNIGTCYTGQGPKKGHPISYSWEGLESIDDDHTLIENLEISVIYTFTTGK